MEKLIKCIKMQAIDSQKPIFEQNQKPLKIYFVLQGQVSLNYVYEEDSDIKFIAYEQEIIAQKFQSHKEQQDKNFQQLFLKNAEISESLLKSKKRQINLERQRQNKIKKYTKKIKQLEREFLFMCEKQRRLQKIMNRKNQVPEQNQHQNAKNTQQQNQVILNQIDMQEEEFESEQYYVEQKQILQNNLKECRSYLEELSKNQILISTLITDLIQPKSQQKQYESCLQTINEDGLSEKSKQLQILKKFNLMKINEKQCFGYKSIQQFDLKNENNKLQKKQTIEDIQVNTVDYITDLLQNNFNKWEYECIQSPYELEDENTQKITAIAYIDKHAMHEILYLYYDHLINVDVTFFAEMKLFQSLRRYEINQILFGCQKLYMYKGDYVYKENDISENIYCVRQGEFTKTYNIKEENVSKEYMELPLKSKYKIKQCNMSMLKTGAFFGEEEVFRNILRNYTVQCSAIQGGIIYQFGKEQISLLLGYRDVKDQLFFHIQMQMSQNENKHYLVKKFQERYAIEKNLRKKQEQQQNKDIKDNLSSTDTNRTRLRNSSMQSHQYVQSPSPKNNKNSRFQSNKKRGSIHEVNLNQNKTSNSSQILQYNQNSTKIRSFTSQNQNSNNSLFQTQNSNSDIYSSNNANYYSENQSPTNLNINNNTSNIQKKFILPSIKTPQSQQNKQIQHEQNNSKVFYNVPNRYQSSSVSHNSSVNNSFLQNNNRRNQSYDQNQNNDINDDLLHTTSLIQYKINQKKKNRDVIKKFNKKYVVNEQKKDDDLKLELYRKEDEDLFKIMNQKILGAKKHQIEQTQARNKLQNNNHKNNQDLESLDIKHVEIPHINYTFNNKTTQDLKDSLQKARLVSKYKLQFKQEEYNPQNFYKNYLHSVKEHNHQQNLKRQLERDKVVKELQKLQKQ